MYDKKDSVYVTFKHLLGFVKDGVPFRVICCESKGDITLSIKRNLLDDLYSKAVKAKSWTGSELDTALNKIISKIPKGELNELSK